MSSREAAEDALIAAARAAARGRVQVGLNLGYGSAMASIGLTIPAIAVASIWLEVGQRIPLQPFSSWRAFIAAARPAEIERIAPVIGEVLGQMTA